MIRVPASLRMERYFFLLLSLLLASFVLIGFWPSYFSRGMIFAVLPSPLVVMHALMFVAWIAFFVIQSTLVSASRTALHRRMGLWLAFLAAGLPIVGLTTAVMAWRRTPSPIDPGDLFADAAISVLFAILVYRAILLRAQPADHKRLMLLATAALVLPALGRWPFAFMHANPPVAIFCLYAAAPLALLAWDFISLRKVHRATLFGLALLVIAITAMFLAPSTVWWRQIAGWLKT